MPKRPNEMNQQTFVEGCLSKYRWERIPEGQVWHDAHYPVPECLGGTETVRLWESDHAVQGVYQSEEVGHPCIFGWEKKWLEGELLERFTFWRSKLGRKGYLAMKEVYPGHTPETRRKQVESNLRNNPNHYRDLGIKARESETQEVRSARGHSIPKDAKARGREKTNTTLYVCLKTGHLSTAGPLTIWQRKRKIDTTQRIRLDNFDNPISK